MAAMTFYGRICETMAVWPSPTCGQKDQKTRRLNTVHNGLTGSADIRGGAPKEAGDAAAAGGAGAGGCGVPGPHAPTAPGVRGQRAGAALHRSTTVRGQGAH